MLFPPRPLSSLTFSQDELKTDKATRLKFGQCALGKRALYVGTYLLSNRYYIPLVRVKRVYKRLAVTKGFYEGKVFGTLAYLVVIYDGDKERVCRFDHEEELDAMLAAVKKHTHIPVGKP